MTLYEQGLLFGTVHTCIGQEPVSIGVIGALDTDRDVIWSNHRGHGHYLAYSDDVEGLVAEVMGRSTGVCRGIGGSQHIHAGNFFTNGVLGGTVACAVGSAFAEKMRGEGAVSVVFMGDGALGEGIVYESFNIASLWDLPVLFVLEHNGIAQTTPTGLAHAGDFAARAAAFGIATAELAADDIASVRTAAEAAVAYVRENSRPYFLILQTYRLMPHSKGDDTRLPEEMERLADRDPLLRITQALTRLDNERKLQVEEAIELRIEAAVASAKLAPYLDLQENQVAAAN